MVKQQPQNPDPLLLSRLHLRAENEDLSVTMTTAKKPESQDFAVFSPLNMWPDGTWCGPLCHEDFYKYLPGANKISAQNTPKSQPDIKTGFKSIQNVPPHTHECAKETWKIWVLWCFCFCKQWQKHGQKKNSWGVLHYFTFYKINGILLPSFCWYVMRHRKSIWAASKGGRKSSHNLHKNKS